ncbi:MAG: helicase-exonuclease AddAB subunit AddA, partial [Oscillospiraceae bacterium]|nr:helicase-exonuclease AddAB subunit AddA [Oscillospiraceae bacterium]
MAKFAPTKDQQRAIEARGSALLVSAAAGSGKTKVLTERLMSYITAENPVGIDTFLVITYTRAAAGELRSRIMEELTNRMAVEPDNAALRRQYALVSRAQISTIHGFCSALIREHCLPLELPPDFKIVDEARTAVMKQSALDKTLEACYERLDSDKGLRELIDTVGAGRDDGRLAALILNLHSKMQSHPYPGVWAEKQRKALYAEGISDPAETVWGRYLLDTAAETAEYWATLLEQDLQTLSMPEYADIGAKVPTNLAESADSLRNFAAAAQLGWDKAAEHAVFVYNRWSAPRKTEHGALLQKIKARRDASKKAMEKVAAEFAQSADEVLRDMRRTAPAMDALLRLTMEFDAAFAADKKRRGFVDYSDLEHFAAKLLSDTEGNPTDLARQISQRYTEIMVDEYQDVNEVQELIFRCVSKNGSNLFTVGDVKQSIYRFRLADPTIFTNKYLTYSDYEEAAEGQPRRILLQENFRSRSQVLEGANAVFENIMSVQLGELEYDDNARLRCGNKSYEGDVPVPQIYVIEGDREETDEILSTNQELEADFVAASIRDLVDRGTPVTRDGVRHPARYGDIVLLMRSANTVVNVYRKALEEHGIPVQSEQGGGFYTTPEVTVMMALLAVVDNPMQDVPLITALQSVYVGFTPDELARVRACDKKACFYDALCIAAGELPKAEAFLQKLDLWRSISGDIPLRELIWRILDDLSVTAVTSAMTDGQVRRRNLMAFIDLAAQFEAGGYQGLRRFVVWLNRQAENGIEPEMHSGESGNAVQIMSIHKSKGLEFPIVFLCDTARQFNKKDSTATVLVHPQMGLGPKVIDSERGIEYYSMPRRALVRKMNRETLSEEMRLLYVAMTRAKEYLFVTGVLNDAEKKIEEQRLL